MSAKELCAALITRALKDLNEDEEEIVVDYLEKLKIRVKLDMKPKEMCLALLEKTMEKEIGKKIPITAYANSIIDKGRKEKIEKLEKKEKEELIGKKQIEVKRSKVQKELERSYINLPSCITAENEIFSRNMYDIVVDPSVGIVELIDGTSQYTAVISLPESLYSSIFTQLERPIVEISSSKGYKTYVRIGEPHDLAPNFVYISPLVAILINIGENDGVFLRLCSFLPPIHKVKFSYYGSNEELEKILHPLMIKLPEIINAFSYLSLGMILQGNIEGKEFQVRVDALSDDTDRPIFAGLIPFSEGDLPFEIEADL